MEKSLVDNKKEEIIDENEKLYKDIGFKNVNIKLKGENISCSKTSIYNYFSTKEEVVEMVTQLSFYFGWPKAWSAFPLVEEVYND